MVSINNSKDLIANSLQLVQEDGELKDIKEVITTAAAIIEGDLTPEQIQTISNLSSALNNDPNFFSNNQAQINSKADINNVYTKSETDGKISDLINDAPEALNTLNKLASALNDNENFATTITGQIATKAPLASPTFTGNVSGVTKSMVGLGNVNNTSDADKEISIATQTALNLKSDKLTTYTKTESDVQFASKTETQTALNLKSDKLTTYTKTEVDTKFTDIINSAPDALNTLSELANALANDSNYATTIANQLATKAPQATTYTKTETDTLLNAKEDVLTAGEPANGFPILSGKGIRGLVATAPLNLTNDGSTSLTVGLDASNIASKTEIDNSAVAWSSGLASDAYHYIETGSDALVIRTPSGAISANFLGNVGGPAYDGKVLFYKDLEVFGSIINTGLEAALNAKANITQIFEKVTSGTETILQLNSNFRFVASNGMLKIQRYDSDGAIITDSWLDVCSFNFNTEQNTSTLSIRNIESDTNQINIKDDCIVTGNFSANGDTSIIAGNLNVYGNETIGGNLSVTGTVSGVSKTMVGLGNVDNTSDLNKPISTTTQTALDLKANQTTTYNKTETDTLLSAKADQSALSSYEPAFTAITPLQKVINLQTGNFELKLNPDVGDIAPGDVTLTTGKTITATNGLIDNFSSNFVYVNTELKTNLINNNGASEVTVNGTLAVGSEVAVDSVRARTANQLTINDNVTINGDLIVNGSNNIGGGFSNPYHVAGRIQHTTIYKSSGRYSFTIAKLGTGFYRINYAEPHPDGTNVIVLATGEGITGSAWNVVNNANSTTYANTASSTTFIWRDQNMTALDATFSFVVLA